MKEGKERNQVDIREFLTRYSGQEVLYCPNPGNGGDAFIAHAAFRLFEELSIGYEVVSYNDTAEGRTLFYGGGGNMIEGRYPHAHTFLKNNLGRGNSMVVLPHTVSGFHGFLSDAQEITVICRENVSYDALRDAGLPEERLYLSEDLAFGLDPSEWVEARKGTGTGNFLRRDIESKGKVPIPEDNLDISMCWNGDLWGDPEFTEAVCRSMALYINRFESVVTDRLHVAIVAALLGKRVHLHPNDYYKVKAVYQRSLNRYANVVFMDDDHSIEWSVGKEVEASEPPTQIEIRVDASPLPSDRRGTSFFERLASGVKRRFYS